MRAMLIAAFAVSNLLLAYPANVLAAGSSLQFEAFRTVCLEHQSDPQAAYKAAIGEGYHPASASPSRGESNAADISIGGELTMRVEGYDNRLLILDQPVAEGGGGLRLMTCSLFLPKPEVSLASSVAAWVGFSPTTELGDSQAFQFRQDPVTRAPIQSREQSSEALAAGRLRAIVLLPSAEGAGLVIMSYYRPTP